MDFTDIDLRQCWKAACGLFLAVSLPTATGCGEGSASANPEDGRLQIVCTTAQVADLLENVGGEHVRVSAMMGPGTDPHLYKPTPSDRRRMTGADVVVYNGLHLEGRLDDLLDNLRGRMTVFAVSDDLHDNDPDALIRSPDSAKVFDPHLWFDPELWQRAARFTAEKLAEIDPDHADDYRANAEAYAEEVQKLAEEVEAELAGIEPSSRVLVTAHDAFAYFGRAYNLEVHGLQGISTLDEADLGAVNDLIALLVERKVRAVFIETSVPPKNIESLIGGCRNEGHEVRLGGELFSDAMGEPGTPEGTYLGMVRHNARTIAEALQ